MGLRDALLLLLASLVVSPAAPAISQRELEELLKPETDKVLIITAIPWKGPSRFSDGTEIVKYDLLEKEAGDNIRKMVEYWARGDYESLGASGNNQAVQFEPVTSKRIVYGRGDPVNIVKVVRDGALYLPGDNWSFGHPVAVIGEGIFYDYPVVAKAMGNTHVLGHLHEGQRVRFEIRRKVPLSQPTQSSSSSSSSSSGSSSSSSSSETQGVDRNTTDSYGTYTPGYHMPYVDAGDLEVMVVNRRLVKETYRQKDQHGGATVEEYTGLTLYLDYSVRNRVPRDILVTQGNIKLRVEDVLLDPKERTNSSVLLPPSAVFTRTNTYEVTRYEGFPELDMLKATRKPEDDRNVVRYPGGYAKINLSLELK